MTFPARILVSATAVLLASLCVAVVMAAAWQLCCSRARGGLKKRAIQSYAISNYHLNGGDESPATCPICLAKFEEGELISVLPPCSHAFHVGCINRWLASHSSCPSCRRIRCSRCGQFHIMEAAVNMSQVGRIPTAGGSSVPMIPASLL